MSPTVRAQDPKDNRSKYQPPPYSASPHPSQTSQTYCQQSRPATKSPKSILKRTVSFNDNNDNAEATTSRGPEQAARRSSEASQEANQNIKTDQPEKPENPESNFQKAGPGFTHTVRNVPGVGLVYGDNSPSAQHRPVNGFNPNAGQQSQLHQTPGSVTNPPLIFPPGSAHVPPFAPTGQQQNNSAMPYTTTFMPNQGQHFQPPVPDTTYGEIPHTYHPRFDNNGGQYVTIGGQTYQMVSGPNAQGGAVGGAGPVQLIPVHQVSNILTQGSSGAYPTFPAAPYYVAQQAASPQPQSSGVAAMPVHMQQGAHPGVQQPVFVQGQTQGQSPFPHPPPVGSQTAAFPAMANQPQMPGAFPSASGLPDVMGIGKTATEVQLEQYHTALNHKALEGQDIQPADPDPSRMYYCRELDGEWTLRNRYGIDHMGDCRWYVMEGGVFYAVRLPN
ncbi:hypothetical protein GGR54DRAFT_648490 [Hypoxylon sp. NC1633]|nr:hypothetical protein GGR54DRAFT_648490 [Hypoxylon sp. NC1633]